MNQYTEGFCLLELELSICRSVLRTLCMSFMLVSFWLYKRSRWASENRRDTLQEVQEKPQLGQLPFQLEQSIFQEHKPQPGCHVLHGLPLAHSYCSHTQFHFYLVLPTTHPSSLPQILFPMCLTTIQCPAHMPPLQEGPPYTHTHLCTLFAQLLHPQFQTHSKCLLKMLAN